MSTSKREEVLSHLRYIRRELRDMDQMLREDRLLPEASEVREIHAALEALYELLVTKGKKKPKPEFDN